MKRDLRIAELQFAVEFALKSAEYVGQSSARVQTVPDTRAIRYYTTLGVLERPAEMKGRTAFYDKRHVLQLVAIKRLQAQGKTLGDIQKELTGLSNRKLGSIAKLPSGFWGSLEKQLSKNSLKAKSKDAKTAEPKVREFILNRSDESTEVESSATRAFWTDSVAADPSTDSLSAQVSVSHETRISFPGGISITIPVSKEEVSEEFIKEILPTVQRLASDVVLNLRR